MASPADRPLCKCHGEPMRNRGAQRGWRCAVRQRETEAKYLQTEKARATRRAARLRYRKTPHGALLNQLYELTRTRVKY